MKYRLLLLLLPFLCTGCTGLMSSKVDLHIPDSVAVNRNATAYQQFAGTRIFMMAPPGYSFISQLMRCEKDDNTFIQATEVPQNNFNEKKQAMIEGLEKAEKNGLVTYYHKEFKLGDCNAYLAYGADNKRGQDQMLLVFGNDSFTVMMLGELPRQNEQAKKDVLAALLSTYVDTVFKANIAAVSDYTIDVSKSDFKFNSHVMQMSCYTIGGTGSAVNDPFQTSIMVGTVTPMAGYDERKEMATSYIKNLTKAGMEIPELHPEKVIVNGNTGCEVTFEAMYKGKPLKVYVLVLGDDKATILYVGSANERQEEMLKQFKEIAQTLKTK